MEHYLFYLNHLANVHSEKASKAKLEGKEKLMFYHQGQVLGLQTALSAFYEFRHEEQKAGTEAEEMSFRIANEEARKTARF